MYEKSYAKLESFTMKKVLISIERWTLPALAIISCILFLLTIGEKVGAGLAANPIEAGVQALTLDSAETGFTLYMNFAINLTFAWAALKIFMASVGLKLDNLLAKQFSRSHVLIIAGYSWQKGKHTKNTVKNLSFARDLAIAASRNNSVVIVLPELDDDQRAMLWQKGIRVVTHHSEPKDTLLAGGISRAEYVFAVCDDPIDNITVTRAALSPANQNPNLKVRCMIEPLSFKRSVVLEEYFEVNNLNKLRLFNQSELVARKILSEFPPDKNVSSLDQKVHVLLFGITSITEAVILQLARIGHYKNNQKPKVTIIGVDVEQRLEKLNSRFPMLPEWLEIAHKDDRVDEISANAISKLLDDKDIPTTAYITGLNEIENLRVAKMLVAVTSKFSDLRVRDNFQVIAIDPPGGTVLSDFFVYGEHKDKVKIFSLFGRDSLGVNSVVARSLLSDLDDSVSIQIHEAYRQKDLEMLKHNPTHNLHPNSVEWSALPENIRDANRAVSDHLEIKLRAVGLELSCSSEGEEINLSEDQIEIMAVMEHRRWWADRSLNGWRFAEERDDINLLHPNMIPYADLSEADKQKDRDSVGTTIKLASADGKKLFVTR